MSIRVGINGFGRIGRSLFRILSDRQEIEIVAINDLFENDQLAYLLEYDTVMRTFRKTVRVSGDTLIVDGREVRMTPRSGRDPVAPTRSRDRHRVDRRLPQARPDRKTYRGGRRQGHPDRAGQG